MTTYHVIAEWAAPNSFSMITEYEITCASLLDLSREFSRAALKDDKAVRVEIRSSHGTEVIWKAA